MKTRSWSSTFLLSLVLLSFAAGGCSAASAPASAGDGAGGAGGETPQGGRRGGAVTGGTGGTMRSGGRAGRTDLGGMGGAAGDGGEAGGGGGSAATGGGGGQASTTGGAGGSAGMGGGAGGSGGGTVPAIPDGPGVFFSGKQETLDKMVAADKDAGYMSLTNGVTVQVHQDIPIEAKAVSDPALPAGTKYMLHSTTSKPGAVNLIWSINFREDKGDGGTRADWQGFDASGFAGLEFHLKASHLKKYRVVAYSGTAGNKASGDMVSTTSWKRVRLALPDDLRFGPGPLDLAALARIDLVISVENDNPPLEWSLTGIRFLTKPQLDAP